MAEASATRHTSPSLELEQMVVDMSCTCAGTVWSCRIAASVGDPNQTTHTPLKIDRPNLSTLNHGYASGLDARKNVEQQQEDAGGLVAGVLTELFADMGFKMRCRVRSLRTRVIMSVRRHGVRVHGEIRDRSDGGIGSRGLVRFEVEESWFPENCHLPPQRPVRDGSSL